MGTDIHGWVEGQFDWADEEDEWNAIIDSTSILGRSYDTFRRLFGVRMRDDEPILPVAANRGLPANASWRVDEETTLAPDESVEPYLDGHIGCHSASWITWSEIQALDWADYGEDYRMLFRLMQILADSQRYTDLRLVVWFDN